MKLKKALLSLLLVLATIPSLHAATAQQLMDDSKKALRHLFADNPKAQEIAQQSSAILVFPTVVKAGFIFGAQGGEGVLYVNGDPVGFYHTRAVSYGLQAGVQKYGYVLFFMNHHALSYLNRSNGWELGVGPSIVVVDKGAAKSMSTTTLQKDIYAFIFSQEGLMAGIGLQGSKITQYTPDK
jgi:lipid-binding SYLF domain-containing protein